MGMCARCVVGLGVAILAGGLGCESSHHASSSTSMDPDTAHVMDILAETPLIDGHNDVPWQYRRRVHNHLDEIDFASGTTDLDPPMHTDIPRLRAGGVGAQFWSVYIPVDDAGGRPGDARVVIEQIDLAHRLIDTYDDLELALTAADIERIHAQGRIASLLGMEGGHSIENSLAVLRATYDLGARYMTITHSSNIPWADSATDDRVIGGLTEFGREVIREMNRLGMIIDLSHVSAEVMNEVLDISAAPVIFSHSSARAVSNHARNVPDDVLRRLRETDGVVMVTFVPSYVSEDLRLWYEARNALRQELRDTYGDDNERIASEVEAWAASHPQPVATLEQVADHIDHVRRVAGIERVGIGGDFDGIGAGPQGLEDVSTYPALFVELKRRGYSDADLRKIAGENLLRVMKKIERVSHELRRTTKPSDALIIELDGDAGA